MEDGGLVEVVEVVVVVEVMEEVMWWCLWYT